MKASLEAVSELVLGDELFFTIVWENSENSQVEFLAENCLIIDGSVQVPIIKDTCLAKVVDVKKYELTLESENFNLCF